MASPPQPEPGILSQLIPRGPNVTLSSLVLEWGGAQCTDLLTAGWESVRCLSESDLRRTAAPPLETSSSAPGDIFLEPSKARRGEGVVQDCACQASSSAPEKGAAVGLSLPSGPQVQDQRSDSHLFLRQLYAFKGGAGWHVRRSRKGRNLQAVCSSNRAVILWPRPPTSCELVATSSPPSRLLT